MCWDYVVCGTCEAEVPCVSVCCCDDDEIETGVCPHRDCGEFTKCEDCGEDLCEDCDEVCEECGYPHCQNNNCGCSYYLPPHLERLKLLLALTGVGWKALTEIDHYLFLFAKNSRILE